MVSDRIHSFAEKAADLQEDAVRIIYEGSEKCENPAYGDSFWREASSRMKENFHTYVGSLDEIPWKNMSPKMWAGVSIYLTAEKRGELMSYTEVGEMVGGNGNSVSCAIKRIEREGIELR